MDYTFRLRENRSSSPVKLTRQTAHSVEIIREENEKGKLGGFGFTLLYEKPPIVGTVTPNSPAERAGLKCKEVIISVNDIPVEDLSHKEVVKLIENTPSTGVWLTVREPDSQSETPDGFSGVLKRTASVSVPGFSPEDYHKLDHRSRSSSFGRSYRHHSPSPTRSSTNLHIRQSSFDEMRRTSDAGRTSSPSKLMVSSRVSSSHSLGTSSPRSGSLPRAPIRATVLVQYIGPVEMPQKWSSRGMSSRCIRECTKRIVSERREYVPLEVYLDLGLSNLKLLNSNKNTLVHYGRKELYYCGVHLDDDHYFGIVTRHSKLLDEMGQSVSTVMSETTHPKTIHRCHVFRIIPPDKAVEMQVQYSGAGNFHQTVKVTNAHAIVQVVREIYNQEMSTDQQQRPLSTGSQDLKVPDFSLSGLSGASASSEGSSTSSLSTTSGSSSPQSHKKKHVVDLTPRHSTAFDVEDGKFSRRRESLERHFYGWKSSLTPERDVYSSSVPHFSMPKWTPSPESFKHNRYEDLDRFPNLLNKRDSFSSSNWSGPSGGSEAYFQVADPQPQRPAPVYATVNKPKGVAPLVRQSSDSSLCVPAAESTTTDSVTGEVTAKRSGLPAKNGPTSSSMTSLWSTTTAGEEPQGRVAGWAASFDRLLQDPIGLRYFMTFLKQEHSEENLLFWLACDEFKKTVKAIPSMLAPSSEKLFNDFVDPVISVQEVNIDDKFRKDLEGRLKTPSVDMFDEVQHQVYRLMRMDSFPRFTRSEAFKELLVQDLEGKRLPVIDVTPYVETTTTPQQTEPAKPKTITRANSTKERHWSLFGRKSRTEHDMQDDDKKKKDFKRKGSKKEVHHPAEQRQSLPQDQDEQGHRQWLNEKLSNVFEIVLTGNITKLVPVPKSGTVRDALVPLLTRQKYSFETVDIKLAASLQSVDLEMPASTLDGQHLVVIQRPDTFTVTLPNSELLLPADGQKTARDICIPALTKEGLDPSSVVLYVLGSRVPLDLNIPGYLLKGQRVVVKMVANFVGPISVIPQDTNTNNVNDDNPLASTSSATDMEDLLEMLMRVQGDTLDQQRSAEPTPEPIVPGNSSHKNSPSGLVTSSRSSSANSSQRDCDTPSPYKSELAPARPGSRSKKHASGNDAVDHSRKVISPLEHRHTQSGSVPSLDLSSYSPLPTSPPAALSQESDVRQQDDRTSVSSQDQQVEMRDLRSKSASPSLDKIQVRRELKDWVASKSDYSRSRQQQQQPPPLHGKLSLPASTGIRYQHHSSPPPPLTRTEHRSEANRRSFNSSNSPTPPMVSPPGSVISSHTSNANSLDNWVMQADSKAAAPHHGNDRSRSPTTSSRYNHSRATMSPPRKDHYGRPIRQPVTYQTIQGWKARTQPGSYTGPASPGIQAPARRYSQGRPSMTDDRRLLMKGDELLQKELEETRAEQGSYHYATTAVAMNKHVPQHRQLPLSPPDSVSSIVSGSIPPQQQQRQQKHYISIAGSSTHETRV